MPRRSTLLPILLAAVPCVSAASPAAGIIHACVQRESGRTRIVPPGEACRESERLVVWNVVGPQGPAGPAGPQGATGPQGPAGSGGGHGAALEVVGQLVIDGINDPSTASPVYSVKIGITTPQGPAGGAGTGKPTFEPFVILKPIDAASPKLMLACATGKHFAKATIDVFGEGGSTAPPILTWELTEVLVSSFGFNTKRDEPTDEVSLSYRKVCSIFEGVDDQRHSTGNVEACFDVQLGQ